MPLRHQLVIFTRWPQLGTGKRRLARGIGDAEALRFQRTILADTIRRLGQDRRWITMLAVTPDRDRVPRSPLAVIPQGSGDLGRRMVRIVRRLPRGPVLIIGSDIPGITPALIERAFRVLGHHDAVFGPAADGGYWAAGLRRRPRLIDPVVNVPWSTHHALTDTLVNLVTQRIAHLPVLEDIDDAEAFVRTRKGHRTSVRHSIRIISPPPQD